VNVLVGHLLELSLKPFYWVYIPKTCLHTCGVSLGLP